VSVNLARSSMVVQAAFIISLPKRLTSYLYAKGLLCLIYIISIIQRPFDPKVNADVRRVSDAETGRRNAHCAGRFYSAKLHGGG
jgi:hypothetical protein